MPRHGNIRDVRIRRWQLNPRQYEIYGAGFPARTTYNKDTAESIQKRRRNIIRRERRQR